MLYFSNMKPSRSASTESTIHASPNENPGNSWSFFNELSLFSPFLSQILYMAGWLFPDGHLPDWLQSQADQWESSEEKQQDSQQVIRRNNGIS